MFKKTTQKGNFACNCIAAAKILITAQCQMLSFLKKSYAVMYIDVFHRDIVSLLF